MPDIFEKGVFDDVVGTMTLSTFVQTKRSGNRDLILLGQGLILFGFFLIPVAGVSVLRVVQKILIRVEIDSWVPDVEDSD